MRITAENIGQNIIHAVNWGPLKTFPPQDICRHVRIWDAGAYWILPGSSDESVLKKYIQIFRSSPTPYKLLLCLGQRQRHSYPDAECVTVFTNIKKQFAADLDGIELVNEPNDAPGALPAPALARMAAIAKGIFAGTGVKIVSPAMQGFNGATYLKAFCDAGGAESVDAFSGHFYAWPQIVTQSVPNVQTWCQQFISKTRAAIPAAHRMKPLYNTECNIMDNTGAKLSPAAAAKFIHDYYTGMFAAGVERIYWYAWDTSVGSHLAIELLANDRATLLPSGLAWLNTVKGLLSVENRKAIRRSIIKPTRRGVFKGRRSTDL